MESTIDNLRVEAKYFDFQNEFYFITLFFKTENRKKLTHKFVFEIKYEFLLEGRRVGELLSEILTGNHEANEGTLMDITSKN